MLASWLTDIYNIYLEYVCSGRQEHNLQCHEDSVETTGLFASWFRDGYLVSLCSVSFLLLQVKLLIRALIIFVVQIQEACHAPPCLRATWR